MNRNRAGCYYRFSSTKQREESIEGQARMCAEYAAKNGLEIIAEYADRGISGKAAEKRSDFQRMLRDAEKGRFDVLLVYKTDRFARNRYDAAIYKAKLKRAGVKVVSVMEVIPEGAEGIILESVLEGFAEYFSANLAENVRRGAKDAAIAGKFNGGQVPYGYNIENGFYIIDEARAAVVREVFQRFVAGETYKAICASLNARGFRTLKGKMFSRGSICSMLNQEKYVGEFVYNVENGDAVRVDGAVPAIITGELWDAALARREKAKHAPRLGKGQEKYVLSRKIFCGHCGQTFHGASSFTGGKHYAYYRHDREKESDSWCPNRFLIRREKMDSLLFAELNKRVLNPQFINEIALKAVELQEADEDSESASLSAELKNVESSLENIYKAIENGLYSQGMQERLYELERRQNVLMEELENAKKTECSRLSVEQIKAYLQGFLDGDINDDAFREKLADSFIDRIVIDNGRADVFLKYSDDAAAISFVFDNHALPPMYKTKYEAGGTFSFSFLLSS